MTFYKECLGGELTMQSVGESPMAGQMKPDTHTKILHATLAGKGFTIMASDMIGPGGVTKGNMIALALGSGNKEELRTFFGKLSAGGNVTHPLKEEFFGTYGDLTDKYGVGWMFNHQAEGA
jgi:PhnB protein